MEQIREIAQLKLVDLNTTDVDAACNTTCDIVAEGRWYAFIL